MIKRETSVRTLRLTPDARPTGPVVCRDSRDLKRGSVVISTRMGFRQLKAVINCGRVVSKLLKI